MIETLSESNLAVVRLVEEICDKNAKFYVSDNPKCHNPVYSDGLEAAVSTALFEAILNPAYIFNNAFCEVLKVIGDEISLGCNFDEVKGLSEKKTKVYFASDIGFGIGKSDIVKNYWKGVENLPVVTISFINDSYKLCHPKDSNIHFEKVLEKSEITQNEAGHWVVNGMAYCSYEYAKQAWLNSQK